MGLFRNKEVNRIKYLFTEKEDSFPVVEFISSPDESLNIPSFILETAWPRVVYIYYPNHDDYQYFHSDFVQIARRIRSESDILVLFYAISCAAHNSMCTNSDLVQTPNRPILKAYESGSSDGKEIIIKSQISTIESANDIMNQLCQALSIGDSITEFSDVKSEVFKLQKSGHADIQQDVSELQNGMFRGIEKRSGEIVLQDTFIDAQKAFILMLEFNVYEKLVNYHESDRNANVHVIKRRAEILKDFLDLCYWSLPPDFAIQETILNLRTSYSSVTKDKEYLQSVLSGSNELRFERWSESCMNALYDHEVINGIDMSSYSCGLWKLLHIIAVGATESFMHVKGDTSRSTPAYVAWVMRDFISEFIGDNDENNQGKIMKWCKGCSKSLIRSYDECEEIMLCLQSGDQSSRQAKTSSSLYQLLSKWLWKLQNHNLKQTLRENIKPTKLMDTKFVYDRMKMDYWPSNLKIVRVSVLKKFKRKLPKAKKKPTRAQNQSVIVDFAVIAFIVICVYFSPRRFRRVSRIIRKKK